MRIGQNPEKNKFNKIVYKQHRIIIPVYIPDTEEQYFNNLFSVFKTSIDSLIKTTHKNQTNITIINNNSKKVVTDFIDQLLIKKEIDKHVKLSSNYGKIYTILSEAKASYEDLITIADADVFYFSNWINKTVKIFNNFKKVGVVAPLPMPQSAYYCNHSLFFDNLISINKGKIIEDKDLLLFEESVNSKISLNKNNWFKNQLYLKKNNAKVCIGAGHFVATYRKIVFDKIDIKKPVYAFKNESETFHLDTPIDKIGFYRLSTIKTYAYHLGNSIPSWVSNYNFSKIEPYDTINKIKFEGTKIPFKIREIIAKIYRKFIKI